MNYDKLLESVKKHEGFRDTVYLDTLNKRTVGFGHLCVEDHWEDGKKYDKEYLEDILEKDLQFLNQIIIYMLKLLMMRKESH